MLKLDISNIEKKFESVQAISEFSTTIHGGQIVGLVGPNGAGKSTLLKIIAGFLEVTQGSVNIYKADDPYSKSSVSYMPERPDLFPVLNVWEHFKFMGIAYNISDWEIRAKSLIERFSLYDKETAFAGELSKGMKQKLMLSLSLLREPEIILLDEPFSGLDPHSTYQLRELISQLKSDNRIIFVSSHSLNDLYRLSDKILIINRGQLIRDQSKESIMAELKKKDYLSIEDLFLEVTDYECR
ncbi:ABC transporter ATP-binding protein [Natranaerobius thermophilus]|uniref:ABC transporter related n=1 Tax=Natranaerobius thermophilus (strain ATCC BAA-1301 / DSM 18059 / JW/NM-WN-LF) TaxID=457570 RepID=B2A5B2_NATTJ|nr:ABC transporter ATP-binding protein [Natranaerobius thermophilus]ACB83946.1 ABC transporter related [Natranaerobius thermophilus JW/NM-WN-LF]